MKKTCKIWQSQGTTSVFAIQQKIILSFTSVSKTNLGDHNSLQLLQIAPVNRNQMYFVLPNKCGSDLFGMIKGWLFILYTLQCTCMHYITLFFIHAHSIKQMSVVTGGTSENKPCIHVITQTSLTTSDKWTQS